MGCIIESSSYYDLVEVEEPRKKQVLFSSEFFAPLANTEVSLQVTFEETALQIHMYTEQVKIHAAAERRTAMKRLLSYDLNDLAVMIGAGLFSGSAAGTIWSVFASASAPSSITACAAVAGFLGGRLLSERAKRRVNGY